MRRSSTLAMTVLLQLYGLSLMSMAAAVECSHRTYDGSGGARLSDAP